MAASQPARVVATALITAASRDWATGWSAARSPRLYASTRSLIRCRWSATPASAAPTAGADAVRARTETRGSAPRGSSSGATVPSNRSRPPQVRAAGTNTSSTTTALLPVARIPDVNQTSSTVTSVTGIAAKRVDSSADSSSPCTMTQSAWSTPVAHSQRPETRNPSVVGTSRPVGASGAAAVGKRAKSSSWLSRGSGRGSRRGA